MARRDEMTPKEALKHKYINDSVLMIDEQTNTNEYQYVMLLYLM